MNIGKRMQFFLKIIFSVIFLLYFSSITFFTHSHVINGVTIVHSHPFAEDNEGKPLHQHTGAEIQLINILSVFFSAAVIISIIALLLPPLIKVVTHTGYIYKLFSCIRVGQSRLRPPPSFIV